MLPLVVHQNGWEELGCSRILTNLNESSVSLREPSVKARPAFCAALRGEGPSVEVSCALWRSAIDLVVTCSTCVARSDPCTASPPIERYGQSRVHARRSTATPQSARAAAFR